MESRRLFFRGSDGLEGPKKKMTFQWSEKNRKDPIVLKYRDLFHQQFPGGVDIYLNGLCLTCKVYNTCNSKAF